MRELIHRCAETQNDSTFHEQSTALNLDMKELIRSPDSSDREITMEAPFQRQNTEIGIDLNLIFNQSPLQESNVTSADNRWSDSPHNKEKSEDQNAPLIALPAPINECAFGTADKLPPIAFDLPKANDDERNGRLADNKHINTSKHPHQKNTTISSKEPFTARFIQFTKNKRIAQNNSSILPDPDNIVSGEIELTQSVINHHEPNNKLVEINITDLFKISHSNNASCLYTPLITSQYSNESLIAILAKPIFLICMITVFLYILLTM